MPLSHPSVSEGGANVSWLQHNLTGDLLHVRNMSTLRASVVHYAQDGMQHPQLSGDGAYVVYGQQSAGSVKMFMKDLTTGSITRLTGDSAPRNALGMHWQKAAPCAATVPDRVLERHIRQQLVRPEGCLTSADLGELTTLDAHHIPNFGYVSSIEGLQHARNLYALRLDSR